MKIICDWDNCKKVGSYKAPVEKDNSKKFRLLCLEHIKEFTRNIKSALRGGTVGCIVGFIPHMGTMLCSTVSYIWEQRVGKKNKTFREDGDIKSLVAAETANNSSIFTGILPLLLIGIPTSASTTAVEGCSQMPTATAQNPK